VTRRFHLILAVLVAIVVGLNISLAASVWAVMTWPTPAIPRINAMAWPDVPNGLAIADDGDGQIALVHVERPRAGAPCDIVTCVAAHSVERRVKGTYTGNLFQLSRTGGGGGTLNIGQSGTAVDTSAIATFCNTTVPLTNAKLTTGSFGCAFHIIYDQAGNANDLTTVGGGSDTPLTVNDITGRPRVLSTTTANQYLEKASPASFPTGNVDKSIYVVMNDTVATNCCTDYSAEHGVGDSTACASLTPATTGTPPDCLGTSFGPIIEWRNNSTNDWGLIGTDLETTQLLTPYTNADPDGSATQANTMALGAWGDVVLTSTYTASGTTSLIDFMGGYIVSTGNTLGQSTPQSQYLRLGAGGDASAVTAIWYEGVVVASALNSGVRSSLAANAASFYGFTLAPSCGTTTDSVVDTLGNNGVAAAFGLRRLNRHNRGAVAALQRASDSAVQSFGTVGCDFDTASAATFCNATTCSIFWLYNQVIPATLGEVNFSSAARDNWKTVAGGSPPAYTASCLGSLPCMTFAGANQMIAANNIGTPPTWTNPYTLFATAKNTASGGGGGFFWGDNAVIPYLGGDYNTSAGTIQCAAGGFPQTGASAANANGTWYATGCQIPDGTHATLFVNGVQTGPTAATISSSTSRLLWGQGGFFAGSMGEASVVTGSLATATAQTITNNMKSYWGF
jgi:hypothetical protein